MLDAEGMMTPPYIYTAGIGGLNAREAEIDPARPQQTLRVAGVLGPKVG